MNFNYSSGLLTQLLSYLNGRISWSIYRAASLILKNDQFRTEEIALIMRIVEKISVRDHEIFQIAQLEFSSFRISFDDSLCDICNEIAEPSV